MSAQTQQGWKQLSEEHLAQALCVYNGLALVGHDGSPEWWVFSQTAKRMLANADGTLEADLAHYKALCEEFSELLKEVVHPFIHGSWHNLTQANAEKAKALLAKVNE